MTTPVAGRDWQPDEDALLLYHYGEEPRGDTADRLDRPLESLRRRLGRLGYSSSLRRRYTPLAQLAADTGYDRRTLLRVSARLGQRVERSAGAARGSLFLFTEAQVEELLAELLREGSGRYLSLRGRSVGRWALGADCCAACGTSGTRSSQRHAAHHLCRSCWGKMGRAQRVLVRMGRVPIGTEPAQPLDTLDNWVPLRAAWLDPAVCIIGRTRASRTVVRALAVVAAGRLVGTQDGSVYRLGRPSRRYPPLLRAADLEYGRRRLYVVDAADWDAGRLGNGHWMHTHDRRTHMAIDPAAWAAAHRAHLQADCAALVVRVLRWWLR